MSAQPKPKKPGRPKLAKEESKAEMLRIRATSEEMKAFDRAAKVAGKSRSEWIRDVLQDEITVPTVATFQREVK